MFILPYMFLWPSYYLWINIVHIKYRLHFLKYNRWENNTDYFHNKYKKINIYNQYKNVTFLLLSTEFNKILKSYDL